MVPASPPAAIRMPSCQTASIRSTSNRCRNWCTTDVERGGGGGEPATKWTIFATAVTAKSEANGQRRRHPSAPASSHLGRWTGAPAPSIEGECGNRRPDHCHFKQQQDRSDPSAIFERLLPMQRFVDAEQRHLFEDMPEEKIQQIRVPLLWISELGL